MTKRYFIENTENFEKALDKIRELVPCNITAEPIEMNYMEVIVEVGTEDIHPIEELLFLLV